MAESRWTDAEAAALIEQRIAGLEPELSLWARHMAARFNAEVFLIGSVLTNPDPRDIDIRIVVDDHEMCCRYGHEMPPCDDRPNRTHRIRWEEVGPTQRQIDDTAKFTSYLSQKWNHNVDVQIVPTSWWRDTHPTPKLLAAPSPRWWFYNANNPDIVKVPTADYFELIKLRDDAALASAAGPAGEEAGE